MTWADARAAILLVIIGVNAISAAPLARKADRKALDRPLAQDEIARWKGILGAVGLDFTTAELGEFSYQWARLGLDIRKFFLDPFKPVFRITGTGQAWALFTYPDRYPSRLVIDARKKGGEWETLYAALDDEHAFSREKLVYRRMRGVYDSSSEKVANSYDPFCSWIAAEVFAAYPEYDEVKVRFQRIHTREPGEAADTLEVEGEKHVRKRMRP